MKVAWVTAFLFVGSSLVIRVDAQANDPPRFEIWVGISAMTSQSTGGLTSAYSPPLLLDGAFTSSASQTVTAQGNFGTGIAAGLNYFLLDRVGIQLLFDRISTGATGTNGDYSVALDYITRLPPNNDPQPASVRHSTKWPDTTGSLAHTAIALNGIVRFGRSDGVSAELSAGPVLYRISGSIQPIAYTTFTLGGHSVLFEDDYRLATELDPAYAFVVNVGGGVNVPIARNVAVVAGFRVFAGPAVDVAVRPSGIANPTDIGAAQPLDDIERALHLPPMAVSLTGSRVFIGVKLRR